MRHIQRDWVCCLLLAENICAQRKSVRACNSACRRTRHQAILSRHIPRCAESRWYVRNALVQHPAWKLCWKRATCRHGQVSQLVPCNVDCHVACCAPAPPPLAPALRPLKRAATFNQAMPPPHACRWHRQRSTSRAPAPQRAAKRSKTKSMAYLTVAGC